MNSSNNDNILYELFAYAEWKPEPDFVLGEVTNKTNSLPYANHLLGLLKPEQTLVDYLSEYNSYLQPWQVCLGDDGKVIAILQDTVLEIRTKRGNFSSTVARAGVPKDPNPQWRKMAWTSDCSLLAVAHSNGKVSFYDLLAINLFNIPADCVQPLESQCTDTTHAIAGIIFLTVRIVDRKWSSELLLVDYKGALRSFFVSPTDGFKFNHSFNFDGGISTFIYHNHHNMLFVSGLPSTMGQNNVTSSSNFGLRGWRLLNDSPFYKLSVDNNEQVFTYTSRMFYYLPFWKKPKQSVITKAVPSPNGSFLGCIHFDGTVSIWKLPTLRPINIWELTSQPDFDKPSPLLINGNQKGWPICRNNFSEHSPIDINWWSNEAIILSRINGSVSICSTFDLHNMLIDKPVFLHGRPQVTNTFDNGFLSLECEASLISPKKLRRKSDADPDSSAILGDDLDNLENLDEEKSSFLSRSTELLKAPLYIITDMERFQPKPKKLNLLSRVYRLLSLKSTTPEELYLRKIENASYDEALTLADTYNLDSDLVYQQQWRSSKVSSESIKDYLGKVSKKIWVIQQCCDRVPETVTAAKELLEFGLKLTRREIFKGMKSKIDKKTFYENNHFDNITPDELSAQSTEILRYRYTMLFYMDRLDIYKAILRSEISNYSSEEYNRLRSNSICKTAIEYAKESRIEALFCLWPHLDNLALQLLVLQNVSETLDPGRYIALLPDINTENSLADNNLIKRSMDWCEKEIFRFIWSSIGTDDIGLEDTIDGMIFTMPTTNLTEWYSARARQIESMSGLASHSFTLIKIAMEKNVPDLENLHSLLLTLDILLYDINIEPLTLTQLEACSNIEISNYLMSNTTHQTIINDMKNLLLPFLDRCEKLTSIPTLKESLLKEYVLNISKKDLSLVLIVFRGLVELDINVQQSLDLADYCFMGQDTNENLSLCFDILETLPESSDDSTTPSMLLKSLDEMERILNACNLMENHGIVITYPELKAMSENKKDLQDLIVKVSRVSKKSRSSAADWNDLLTDILNLDSFIMPQIDNELCHEIFASALLSSGNKPSITSAEQVLTCQSNNMINSTSDIRTMMPNKTKPPFKLTVSYKISLTKSISLVLQSAREYFNSASSLNDSAIEFAWTCLQLIKDDNEEIQLERDLISALKLLNDFDLSILPVQVRLYPSKIAFIEECLNCNERAYKSVEKVLELAKLLRVAGEDERKREIMIVSLCAIKSIETEDYDESKKLGKRLIKISEGLSAIHAVSAAHQLGSNPYISDLPLRHNLLNLALLHCEPQHIEVLLQIRSSVESDILQNEINNLVNMTSNVNTKLVNLQDSMESTEDDYLDALTSPMVENKSITSTAQAVEKYIQKPLSALGDRKTWKNALSFSWATDNTKSTNNETQTKNQGKLACHAFYSHMHENCYTSIYATQYNKFTAPDVFDPQLVMLYSLIRNSLLLDCIKYGSSEMTHTEAFVQCAEHTLPEDTSYCVSQLLSVSQSEDFNRSIKNIILDIKTVSTFLYFYSLAIYINTHASPDEGFFLSPIELVSDIMKSSENLRNECNNNFIDGLHYCKTVMAQLIEGKKLVELGCNVNVELFAQDAAYRKSSILNLSRTENKDIFQLAIQLAKKYNIEEKEVIFNYISFIIVNHKNLQVVDLNNIISDPVLSESLLEDASEALERFNNCIWKILNGKDHHGLLLYFNLISHINHRHLISGLNAKEHIKLIKKTKSACTELDYKYILSSPQQDDLFTNVIPLLTRDNIGLITKLLRNLPSNLNFQFNSSNFYREWLLKFFYLVPEYVQSSKKWMQQHRECSSYFSKLNKEDLISFTSNILFSSSALQKLPSSTRIQIAFQTADYCHHEHHNNENINFHTKQSEDDNSWENIGTTISKWGKFLESFHSENSKQIIQISHDIPGSIWINIETSRGEKALLLKPLSYLLLDNSFTTKSLTTLIDTINEDITANDVLINVIDNTEFDSITLSSITKTLVELKLDEYPIHDDILKKMKPFTTSSLLSSKQRLDLMSLYKIQSHFDDAEILEKMSKELISNIWGDDVFNGSDDINMSEALSRRDMLIKLINGDVNWEKLKALVDLVNMWPSQANEEDKSQMVNIHLVIKLLNSEHLEENVPLFKLLLSKQQILENDVAWIITNNEIKNSFGKLWLCLLCSEENVYRTLLPKVALEIQDEKSVKEYTNDSLLAEILRKNLFVAFVRTRIYPELVQFLFKHDLLDESENQYNYNVQIAIRDLLEKRCFAEAGALKMTAMGIPQTLKNFSQSLMM